MPHLQQRARELLSELTAARARVLTPAVSETEQTRAPDHQEVEHRRVATASATSMNDGDGDTRETTSSLRRECETLRIVAQALREKDEDSQVKRNTGKCKKVRGALFFSVGLKK